MFNPTKYETQAKELFGAIESDSPLAFRHLTKVASQIGTILEKQDGEQRRRVIEILTQVLCQDCGERHDDEALEIPLEQRCRCVLWCDE